MNLLIRFSGYLAAAVIFIAWFINNFFVTAMQETKQTLDAVRSEQAEAANLAQINDLTEGQRALFKKVFVLENGGQSEEKANLDWVESLELNSARLARNAEALQELVGRVDPEGQGELVQAIHQSVESTRHFSEAIHAEADAYKQSKANESLDSLQATDKAADGLDATLGEQYAKMEAYIEKKSERSASAEKTASLAAYLFSALGAGLGGAGKWLEKNRKKAA